MKIIFLSTLLSIAFPTTLIVPSDEYPTIQSGIDAATVGDTVLVSDGFYDENLILDKSIVLASHAVYDDLSEWITDEDYIYFGQWVVANSHIANTRIRGDNPEDPDFGSVILISTEEDECIYPEVIGFTIEGGSGTRVIRHDEFNFWLGGGILADVSDPLIHYNQFVDNGSDQVFSGGGTYSTTEPSDWGFDNRRNSQPRCEIDEIRISNNLYNGNDATYGNSFANTYFEGDIDMSGSIFDVFNCTDQIVSTVWVDTEPTAAVDFEDGAGNMCAFTAPDVYVNSNIDQECLDEGCGFENNPFKTITRTLEMISPSESNPITIHLAAGIYSPETGEIFPIIMMSNINLIGEDEQTTVLDAMDTHNVIFMENCNNNYISYLTITGGNENINDNGYPISGGITMRSSNPKISNVTLTGNTADKGGGMSLFLSHPILNYVKIIENTADKGGGIRLYESNPILTNVLISQNSAEQGGGVSIRTSNNPIFNNVIIIANTADDGGGIDIESSNPIFTNITISQNTGNHGGGIFLRNESNPIVINSIIEGNSSESIYLEDYNNQPFITYSNIEGGWEGEGNIDSDPLFVDPENGDYTLQENSPCIDTGNPDIWHQDLDGSQADMGATGGLFILPNFTNYNFGEVGDLGSSIQFNLYNYRQISIIIDAINFNTSSFSSPTSLPLTIEPFQTGIINIEANNTIFGYVEDAMEIISEDLPEALSVSLQGEGVEGNILSGNLSGSYEVETYRISGDLTIAEDDTVYLHAGTDFLFDGGVSFNIYGTLKAIGTEVDSIIFDNFSEERWAGFTLDNVFNDTEFRYVRISGAEKEEGGGMDLYSSNPTFTHVKISGNIANEGGGINLHNSNPIFDYVNISNNISDYGGGIYLLTSNPMFTHVTISKNYAQNGAAMTLYASNPVFLNVTISDNHTDENILYFNGESFPVITNSIFWYNIPEFIIDNENQLTITYSNIEGGWEGEGNINIEPMFTDPENGDYILQESSPCIDAGTADLDGDGGDDIEIFAGSAPDMGAFEYGCLFIDDCGICEGDNSICTGCMDESACNYNEDATLEGECSYADEGYDCDGNELSNKELLPTSFDLSPAYPNPFNPSTNFHFSVPIYDRVDIHIYDMRGKLLTTLANGYFNPGHHSVSWNASSYASGVYFVKMQSSSFTDTQKIMLLK